MKSCSCCGQIKALDAFSPRKNVPSGRDSRCKQCRAAAAAAKRAANPEWAREQYKQHNQSEAGRARNARVRQTERYRRRHTAEQVRYHQRNLDDPEYVAKRKARLKLNDAVKCGWLTRPSECPRCGRSDRRIEGHHHDHSQPLVVEWLCSCCHNTAHRDAGMLAGKGLR